MSETEYVSDHENDLEVILDADQPDFVEEQTGEDNGDENNENQENAEDETKKEVKPKRVVKNPQPKLNEQTLKGPKGLAAIENYFERVKFKGRGYEEQDLNVILKTYEYWCHRLFPKYPFDSCIARLETLGTKRATQTQIKKIRMGLNFDEVEDRILNEEEVEATEGFVDTYNDQFDQLVSNTSTAKPRTEITEEQLLRIQQNRERALRIRAEKLRKQQENSNNFDALCSMDTQDIDATAHNSQSSSRELQDSDKMQTEGDSNEGMDNEDDIENILDYINTDEDRANSKTSERELNNFSITQSEKANSEKGLLSLEDGSNQSDVNMSSSKSISQSQGSIDNGDCQIENQITNEDNGGGISSQESLNLENENSL